MTEAQREAELTQLNGKLYTVIMRLIPRALPGQRDQTLLAGRLFRDIVGFLQDSDEVRPLRAAP